MNTRNWKDTVLTEAQLRELLKDDEIIVGRQAKKCLEEQAKIAFKVGLREAVEDLVITMEKAKLGYKIGAVEKYLGKWQTFLKG